MIKAKQKEIVSIPAGTYIARCYEMIEIGTTTFNWQGENIVNYKVRIGFELPTELKVFKEGEKEKPYVISSEYTLSLHEKSKLRPLLESWRGKKFTEEEVKDFDISKLIGVPAMLSIIHNDKGYANIASISKLPKGTECPPQVNPSKLLEYDTWNDELFQSLSQFLKNKIMGTPEYKKLKGLPTTFDPNKLEYPENNLGDMPF